jgi:hypothetical protein
VITVQPALFRLTLVIAVGSVLSFGALAVKASQGARSGMLGDALVHRDSMRVWYREDRSYPRTPERMREVTLLPYEMQGRIIQHESARRRSSSSARWFLSPFSHCSTSGAGSHLAEPAGRPQSPLCERYTVRGAGT